MTTPEPIRTREPISACEIVALAPTTHSSPISTAAQMSDARMVYHARDVACQDVRGGRDFQRPAWLSPEIGALMVAALDLFLIPAAAAAAVAAYTGLTQRHLLIGLFAGPLFVGMFSRLGGYRLAQLPKLRWQVTRTLLTWGATVSVLLLVAFLSKTSDSYSRAWAVTWVTAAPLVLLAARCGVRIAIGTRAGGSYFTRNVVVIGAGDEGRRLIAKLQEMPEKSVAVCAVFDDRKSRLSASLHGINVLGTTDDLLDYVRSTPVDEIVIALPLHAEQRLKALCDKLKALAVDLRISVEPLAEKFQFRGMSYVGDVPVFEVANRPLKNWMAVLKWVEDKLLAALLLVFLSPLMAVLAVLIKLDSAGPVFFVQQRFGFNNEVIGVLKFRTMYIDHNDPTGAQRTVQNDPRVTRLGRFLRLLSMDELPQLVNVLRGDMSLVGPRPHAIAMRAGDCLYWEAV